MRYRILPYKQGSKSAKALADNLGGKVLRLNGSTYSPRASDLIVNWGNATATHTEDVRLLNPPQSIRQASNKLIFFGLMKEAASELIPEFWTSPEAIPDEAFPIVCRTILAGHSGAGIVLAASRDQLVHAPLYVAYVPKRDEYRIHVGKGGSVEIIAVQKKARRLETPDADVNWKVRNHSNGFIFQRQNVNPPEAVLDAAKRALLATGLDFAGIDVIWNEKRGRAYVLEANTACGLEGQTVQDYADFFRGLA